MTVAGKPIKRILVALDGSSNSKRALAAALQIAAPSGASVTGIVSVKIQQRNEIAVAKSADKEDRAAAESIMEKAAAEASRHGVRFSPKIKEGDTRYNIVKAAHSKSQPCDMLVIGSRGHGSLKKAFFGSTSNYVVHASDIPVLVVK